ncbi:MAG TPA: serine hydrolase [Candidatus Angelobacter sp.]|nr:serine hydrolase [Candidatus Angelobacter sp.]
MKNRLFFSAKILFSFVAVITAVANLSASARAGDNNKPARVASTPDIAPETVLLKIQFEQSQPPLELTLKQLMDTYKIPGLSVAVVDDYKIVWAKGFGVTEYGGSTPVTTRTLFQAGSISKPVAAVGAMWLVERGKLQLDEDVNQKLKTWKVPENDFTKDQKVTLRRLMSHSAGLTVHGFPGYAVGGPLPNLVQIFNGKKPANTAPIRVDFVPGTKMRYSGGGVTIEQQLVIDVTGKPFPQFMQQTVLSKIGMTDSSYEQPLPAGRAAQTATGTRDDGMAVEGRWHIYPEMAAAGLWTTPTDLAKFGIEIALSKHGKANHVLSQKSVEEMLKPQVVAEGDGNEHVGLAFFLEDKMPGEFGHNGSDEGFQALLTMNSETGRGIAIMGNSDAFFWVAPHVEEAVRRARGWQTVPKPHSAGEAVMLLYHMKGTQGAMEAYDRFKQGVPGYDKPNEGTLNGLGYMQLREKKIDEAIKTFQRNVDEYPKGWNCYDSLGEAYMIAGQKELAIKNYEKSLELNPENTNGAGMLKKLRGQ